MGLDCLVWNRPVIWQLTALAGARFTLIALLVMPVYLCILMHIFAEIALRDVIQAVLPSAIASISAVGAMVLFQISGWLANGKPLILLIAESVAGGTVGFIVLVGY